jgi:hypothetical protein
VSIAAIVNAQFGPIINLPEDLPTVMPAPPAYPPTVASTAVAPYFAPPAWSQTLAPNVRFVILSNFQSSAVLDRETGLVWARQTVAEGGGFIADDMCRDMSLGNRVGWRLPAVAELQSLIDTSVPHSVSQPRLPAGHPFVLSPTNFSFRYWASELHTYDGEIYRSYVFLGSGRSGIHPNNVLDRYGVLCVRGAQGFSYLGPLL